MRGSSETKFLQELLLYAASAALSCLVLFAGLRQLDPNREASKKALEHKKEIAKRLGRPLIQTNPYEDVIACDVINPDHIDVEFGSIGGLEAIKQAFLAYKLQPAIIFIDEVDSFLGQRRTTDHEALTNMKTEFMALWDGFTTDQNAQVMVLAATNRPSELDEAILRRLPQAFEIGMPDQRERAEILKVVLKGEKIENNIDFNYIASLCEGYTGSDLLELCKKAAYFPIREILDEEKKGKNSSAPRPLSQADLQRVLATSTKTGVAANEYSRSSSQSPGWPRQSDDYQVQATINELSKLMVSQILNLQPPDNQDT
ncbi:ATPase family AAA domain-containing protein 1-B-like [Populus alba x Populus x berolinensis]|uniref:ATPase family AAA domain-containing protein 1-B-like n=1 Tax=Populus alba x Populus x berolinensis TaxID=444605 RepID=A0AAD6LPS5_9ROSI|nr:ATPase family AAA domain-containing protein 1-B-like [Populus alba x Populus x berolinensis]